MATPNPAHLRRRIDQHRRVSEAQNSLPGPAERRSVREAAGLSLADVAVAVGVTASCISQWERGHRDPKGERLTRYLKTLRVMQDSV